MSDVDRWLAEIGLAQYVDVFRAQAIDAAVLPTLTDADLKELGLPLGHRRKLLAAIQELLARDPPVAPGAAAQPDLDRRPAGATRAEAERRHLTVMFCDLVGSTALSTRLDPEELHPVIRFYQDAVAGAIARYGGFVAKFLGDGVLIYFGYPRVHEDDAGRAVRAGLEAVQAVARLKPHDDVSLQCRIGIATGFVVVSASPEHGSAFEQAVIGETPNLAARLQELAPPGGVVLAESTRSVLGGSFELRPLGRVQMKGLDTPVEAWLALGERDAASRFEAAHAAALTRLIGRDSELALLLDRWSMAREGDGQVVLLSGEAGIGKSRLCQSVRERLAGEPHGVILYQCSPYHTGSPLYPVVRQLELASGMAESDAPVIRREKLEHSLTAAGIDLSPTSRGSIMRLMGEVAPPEPGPRSPQQEKAQTLLSLIELLQRQAARQPLLLILEDAHWIDPTSDELIGLVVDRLRNSRVLLVVTFRPDFVPSWGDPAHVVRLAMSRLGRRQCTALAEAVAGEKRLPAELLSEIVGRTDGVPLFVEELTRTVLDSGLLASAEGGYRLDRPLGQLAIPASLQDMLMARLDRLERAKEVAQVGAAIGREFSHRVLAASLTMDEPQLVQAVDELLRTELVFRRGVPPDATYSFKHALIRDAAYDSMLKSRRQACHARIAEAIERCEPDTVATRPELLAYHHEQGHRYPAAFRLWSKAGDLAAGRSASREAAGHYRSALALLPRLPEAPDRLELELDLNMSLGNALMQFEGYSSKDSHDAYARARTIASQLGRTEKYVSACIEMAPTLFAQARYRDVLELFGDISARQIADTDPVTRVHSGAMMGVAQFCLGNFDEAWRATEEAMRLDDVLCCTHEHPIGGGDPAIVLRNYGSRVLHYQGYPQQAQTLVAESMVIAKSRKHRFTVAWAMLVSALAMIWRGAFDEAESLASEVVELCVENGFTAREGSALWERGLARVNLGRSDEGLADLRQGVRLWETAGGKFHVSEFCADAANALIEAGLHREAEEFLATAEEIQRGTDERMYESELLRVRGRLLLVDGDRAAAKEHFHHAIVAAERQGAKLFALRAATDLARLLREAGEESEAISVLRPVYDWFTEGFEFPDLLAARAVLEANSG